MAIEPARRGGEKTSWGIAPFLLALAMGYASWRAWNAGVESANPYAWDRILVLAGLVGAAVAAWFGRASYPRVHNFKIYALSFSVSTVSILAVVIVFGLPLVRESANPEVYSAAVFLAYASLLFALLVTVVAPEYLDYRSTVRITAGLVVLIVVAVVGGTLTPELRGRLAALLVELRDMSSTVFWAFSAVAAAILLLSLFSEAHSMGIGGIHSGAVILLSVGWLPAEGDIFLLGMVLAWMPLLVAVGTLSHWFQRLENRAAYDPLLRIYNRGWCDQVLAERSRMDTRPPFALALIDLDHFKAVNDSHGHDAGDQVLQEIAQRVRLTVVPHATVGRYGGEELIVFMPHAGAHEARELLEGVRSAVEDAPVKHRKRAISMTCSIGYAIRTERDQPLSTVLKAADRALYVAKDKGRNQIRLGRLRKKA